MELQGENIQPCEDVIKLEMRVHTIEKEIGDIKNEVKGQNIAMRNNDITITEIHKDIKQILKDNDVIKADIKEHEKKHYTQQQKKSDRNWGLWILLIANILSIIVGTIMYNMKN